MFKILDYFRIGWGVLEILCYQEINSFQPQSFISYSLNIIHRVRYVNHSILEFYHSFVNLYIRKLHHSANNKIVII